MTVLHLLQCTNLGGMEQVAYRLMADLSAAGIEFRLATPRPFGLGEGQARRFDPDMRAFPYRGRFGWRDFPAFRRHIHRLADECSHIWITGTSAAALAAVIGLRKPKVLSHHYHHFEGSRPWLRWRSFYELFARQLDAITYPTNFTRNEALRIAPWLKNRAHVVPNGFVMHYVDEPTRMARRKIARQALGVPDDAFVVGNAGWLIPRKRFDVFLRTAARLKAVMPNALFMVCGGGPLEADLKRLAGQLGLSEAVRFEGWRKDLGSYYDAWDVLLFNSDFDTLPAAPMEAASYGCITVASLTYGGLGEFLVPGKTGELFDRHDEAALAGAIFDIASDPNRARALRQAAVAKLSAEYSTECAMAFYRAFFA